MNQITKYLFMGPVLRLIDQGRLFGKNFAMIMRGLGALVLLGMFIGWCRSWEGISDLKGFAVVAGVIFQVAVLVGIYALGHVLWVRSGDIANLPPSEFTVIPIVSALLKMIGEMIASLLVVFGVAGFFLLLFATKDNYMLAAMAYALPSLALMPLIGPMLLGGSGGIMSAVVFLIGHLVGAFFWLTFTYFLSEVVVVLADIARNIRVMRNYYQPSTPAPAPTYAPVTPTVAAAPVSPV